MSIAWKRTLLAVGVVASSAFVTPALAGKSEPHARRHFGHSREAQARQHARHFASARRASARRARRIAASERAGSGGSSSLVAEARRFLGGNPTGWAHDWCGRFMNLVLARTGHRGTGSNFALSFARYGRRLSGPQVGAVAVMARGGGGHVGVVSGVLPNGDVKVISGNHGHKVAESVYSRGRILAFVLPTT
jgi:uncharacterized protein (TIGR02594 family)